MKILVIGAGYVGIPTAACLADFGNKVICYDKDKAKIDQLSQGIVPIYEPSLEEVIKKNLLQNRLWFLSGDFPFDKFDLVFVCVGTPSDKSGKANLNYLWEVFDLLALNLKAKCVIVIKSTVPIGTTDLFAERIKEKLSDKNIIIDVAFCPEFLKQGNAVKDTMSPDRVVIGTKSEHAKSLLKTLYAPFTKNHDRTYFMEPKEAEMVKYASNAMLATRISFMNELSLLCDKEKVDIENVRVGIGSDQRIGFSFLYAGIGYGGSCFPKDIDSLITQFDEHEIDCRLLKAVKQRNEEQKKHLFSKIYKHFNGNLDKKVFAVWGVAFKAGTDDLREAPALVILRLLLDHGAQARIYDPVASKNLCHFLDKKDLDNGKIEITDNMYTCLEGVDSLIILTDWSFFRNPELAILQSHLQHKSIFDARNQLEPREINKLQIKYYGMGRSG